MDRRVLLGFAAAAVAALGIVLYLAMRGDAAATTAQKPSPPSTPEHRQVDVPPTDQPAGRCSDTVRTYKVDCKIIRDHRTGSASHEPPLPRVEHKPGERQIAAAVTADLSTQIKSVLADCTKTLPEEARGAR